MLDNDDTHTQSIAWVAWADGLRFFGSTEDFILQLNRK